MHVKPYILLNATVKVSILLQVNTTILISQSWKFQLNYFSVTEDITFHGFPLLEKYGNEKIAI